MAQPPACAAMAVASACLMAVAARLAAEGHRLLGNIEPNTSGNVLRSARGCVTVFAVCVLGAFWVEKAHFDRMDENNSQTTPLPETSPADSPPLGEKTTSLIFDLFQEVYRQEIGAEEDVHRTLPFFATALGLIIASLNYSATQLPSWGVVLESCRPGVSSSLSWHIIPCAWLVLVADLSLFLVMCLSGAVL